MGNIRWKRVLLGGALASVVLNVVEYVLHGVVLEEQWQAAMEALGRSQPGGGGILIFVVALFVIGVLAVWVYAAIRPRFGPGPRTAVYAGLAVWALAYLIPAVGNVAMEVYPNVLMLGTAGVGLIEMLLATVTGAWVYKEE